jgi:hypothetical protein
MHISYAVGTFTSGNVSVVIDTSTSTLSDENGKSVPYSVVPGPPSFILAATGLLFCLAVWRLGPGRIV